MSENAADAARIRKIAALERAITNAIDNLYRVQGRVYVELTETTAQDIRDALRAHASLSVELANMTAKHAYEERRANALRDERNKCTEAARLNGTADVAALRAEQERLRAVLTTLVAKLDSVHADPQYMGVWTLAHIHGYHYTGLQYKEELDEAKAALASTPPSQER